MRIVSLQPQETSEIATVARLQKMTTKPVTVVPVETQLVLLQEVAAGSVILCQRFHGALASLAQGKEVRICPMEPGDKLAALEAAVATQGVQAVAQHWRESAELGEAALLQALHRLESVKSL